MLEKVNHEEELQFGIIKIVYKNKALTLYQNEEYSNCYPDLESCKRIAYGLSDDAERKGTILVIAENPTDGVVYRYGNHGAYWEKIGTTCGYA